MLNCKRQKKNMNTSILRTYIYLQILYLFIPYFNILVYSWYNECITKKMYKSFPFYIIRCSCTLRELIRLHHLVKIVKIYCEKMIA